MSCSSGISPSTIRDAERTRLVNTINADPSAARFSPGGGLTAFDLNVRMSEPSKSREGRIGGFGLSVQMVALIAFPLGTARPEPARDFISIVDYSGEWLAYDLKSVEPLRGTDCYNLGLAARRTKPTGNAPVVE